MLVGLDALLGAPHLGLDLLDGERVGPVPEHHDLLVVPVSRLQ